MTRLIAVIAVAICLFPYLAAGEQLNYSSPQRRAYIERALSAFRQANQNSLKSLTELVDQAEKHQCRSFFDGLTLNCLLSEAKRFCEGPGRNVPNCDVMTDFLVVNKVNERQLVSRQDRARLSQNYEDYQKAYDKTLLGKYAFLTSDLLLNETEICSSSDNACMSGRIDEYCRVSGDEKNVAWQACAAGIVWFVGTAR